MVVMDFRRGAYLFWPHILFVLLSVLLTRSFVCRYASVAAIESPFKEDDTQWLTYWVLYSFFQLIELSLERILNWYADDVIYFFLSYFFHREVRNRTSYLQSVVLNPLSIGRLVVNSVDFVLLQASLLVFCQAFGYLLARPAPISRSGLCLRELREKMHHRCERP